MESLKFVLSLQEPSPQVKSLLECLGDPSFDLDVYICSVGGVGSTELGNFLTRHGVRCNLLTDQDALRHVSSPPSRLGGGATRVVYLFGDPLASVASHYRRGIAHHQALKTSGNPRLAQAAFPATFDDYVTSGEDLFGYEAHLRNWLEAPTGYDVFFARYERLFDRPVADALLAHACGRLKTRAELASMATEWCASKRERRSRVTDDQRARMYVGLCARMDALPPAFLRRAGGGIEPCGGRGGGGGEQGQQQEGQERQQRQQQEQQQQQQQQQEQQQKQQRPRDDVID